MPSGVRPQRFPKALDGCGPCWSTAPPGIDAATVARLAGIPVLLDGGSWKPGLERLIPLVDAAVLSADFAPPEPVDWGRGPWPSHTVTTTSTSDRVPSRARSRSGPVAAGQTLGAGDVPRSVAGARGADSGLDDFAGGLRFATRIATPPAASQVRTTGPNISGAGVPLVVGKEEGNTMSLTEMARDKAEKERAKGRPHWLSTQLNWRRPSRQGCGPGAHRQGARCDIRPDAKIGDLQMQLADAQANLTRPRARRTGTEAVTSPGIIRGVTQLFRQAADATVSQAQAQVDALQAEISQAQSQAQTPPADTSPELEAANRGRAGRRTLSPRHRCASTWRRRPSTRSIDLPP